MLEDYDYDLEYRSSQSMQHVDVLSRTAMVNIASAQADDESRILKVMQLKDPEIKIVVDAINTDDNPPPANYKLRNGILCYEHKPGHILYVTPRALRYNIVRAAHDMITDT